MVQIWNRRVVMIILTLDVLDVKNMDDDYEDDDNNDDYDISESIIFHL